MRLSRICASAFLSFVILASSLAVAAELNSSASINYNPRAQFQLKIFDVPFRVTDQGRQLMARIYQPVGSGPFPVLLDLHGGAWNNKDRLAEAPMDQALAASGILVVAIDLTVAKEVPYPASIQDASYGIRWLKQNAHQWGGDASTLGLYGSSSGGHIAELLGMKPNDSLYNALAIQYFKDSNTLVRYIVTRSPISNTEARYENALSKKRENMINNNLNFFKPWDTITSANPQKILERREFTRLPPLLIMQGELDDNVLPKDQEHFAKSYQAAGGECEYVVFKDSEHEWVAKESEQTTRARELAKQFIAKQLKTTPK
jgi:acetyl esterase/lipase